MEFASLAIKRIHVLRVDPGEDVLASIQEFLQNADVRQAVVLGGYGTLAAYHLHWVMHNRIPTNNAFGRGEGGIEILSMNVLVGEGEPHVHVTLATQEGAFGGHLEPGCTAYVLCEVYLAEVEGLRLSRQRVPVAVEGMGEGTVSRLSFDKPHATDGQGV
jgi:predicted DNA-binding protein with PD1-like motif